MMEKLALKVANETIAGPGGIPEGGFFTVRNILQSGLTALLIFAGIGTLLMLIFGGIRWITSGGDKERLEGARKTIVYAIVGLIIVFLSFFIVNFIGDLFGVDLVISGSSVPHGAGPLE